MRKTLHLFFIVYIITIGCNSKETSLLHKDKSNYISSERIMNRVKVNGEIKHIDQQTLLDNLDAYASQRGSDRIYVISPEGKRGTVELRELKNMLNIGYQLIDDTEGYNNRPDIRAKKQAKQIKTNNSKFKLLKMNEIIVPVLILILIGVIITLSNKTTPPKYLIINNNAWRWIKIILTVVALYIAYLFALNGRYTDNGDYIDARQLEYRDKWKIQM